MNNPTEKSSTEVYKRKHLTVREEELEFGSGYTTTHVTVDHPGAVVILPINELHRPQFHAAFAPGDDFLAIALFDLRCRLLVDVFQKHPDFLPSESVARTKAGFDFLMEFLTFLGLREVTTKSGIRAKSCIGDILNRRLFICGRSFRWGACAEDRKAYQ